MVDLGERAGGFWFLVRDPDAKSTRVFDDVMAGGDIRVIKIPPWVASRERVCRAVGTHSAFECTDRMLIFGERHLRTMRTEYAAHYNRHRPHRSPDLRAPADGADVIRLPTGRSNAARSSEA